jgi:HEAT repeat protein
MSQTPTPFAAAPNWEESMRLLERLPALSAGERADAIKLLLRDPSPGVRERALRVAAAILPQATLASYLGNHADAVLRNAGLEILKLRGARSFSLAVDLLQEGDTDLVLQAVLLLDHLRDPRGLEPLRGVLGHADANVVQSAIVAIGHLGDARTISDLLPFLEADTWLRMAAVQALGDLRSPQAVPQLTDLLADLMVGPMAAEALARIGGGRAFRSLAEHWLRHHKQLDPETMLGLLAHAAEGLQENPSPWDEFRASLSERLRDPYAGVRVSAARCLLALGSGPEDAEALNCLAGAARDAVPLPTCLARRGDLIATLIERRRIQRHWGYLLAARHPGQGVTDELAMALESEDDPRLLTPIAALLERLLDPRLAEPLLDLYLRQPAEARSDLAPALLAHRKAIEEAANARSDLEPQETLVLASHLGAAESVIADGIEALDDRNRATVIPQLADRGGVLQRLPWKSWLERAPEIYADLAARVAVQAGLRELLPALRQALESSPNPELILSAGDFGDRDSVTALLAILDSADPGLGPLVIESLGRIGGPEARHALRRLTSDDEPSLQRHAFRALALCASDEDEELFRMAATHPDWLVRLACTDVLGRFSRAENMEALTQLAADPVAIVAQRAVSNLEQ